MSERGFSSFTHLYIVDSAGNFSTAAINSDLRRLLKYQWAAKGRPEAFHESTLYVHPYQFNGYATRITYKSPQNPLASMISAAPHQRIRAGHKPYEYSIVDFTALEVGMYIESLYGLHTINNIEHFLYNGLMYECTYQEGLGFVGPGTIILP